MMGPAPLPVTTEATELLRAHLLHQERRGNLPRSIEKRQGSLKSFARWLAPRGMLEASRTDIELFLDGRRTSEGKKINPRTRYYWIAHLHAFFKWAILEDLITVDPTVAVVRPIMRRVLPRPIDGDDLIMAVKGARPQLVIKPSPRLRGSDSSLVRPARAARR